MVINKLVGTLPNIMQLQLVQSKSDYFVIGYYCLIGYFCPQSVEKLFNCNRKLSDIFVLSGYFVVFVMQKLGQNNPISTVFVCYLHSHKFNIYIYIYIYIYICPRISFI